jgi:hypothetical protein
MGARNWMLVHADGNARELLAARPELDREATSRLAAKLFPKERLEPLEDGELSYTCPPDDEIDIGCFPGLSIVAAEEFAILHPSKLSQRFLESAGSQTVYLHAMHSVGDWLAFAIWRDGKLERSLSLSAENGRLEDFGQRMSFELPYWSGEHPAVDPADETDPPYPFPFHPLELGEAALLELFGYQLEGSRDEMLFDPEDIPLARFKRKRSRFKFW